MQRRNPVKTWHQILPPLVEGESLTRAGSISEYQVILPLRETANNNGQISRFWPDLRLHSGGENRSQ